MEIFQPKKISFEKDIKTADLLPQSILLKMKTWESNMCTQFIFKENWRFGFLNYSSPYTSNEEADIKVQD